MSAKFKELADEVGHWPSNWKTVLDGDSDWVGDWSTTNKNGEEDVVESDIGSGYANEFSQYVALLANTAPQMLEHITELESAIRETIPVLERSGRVRQAVKLRKLVGE